jgi:hypothetical protein
MIIQASPKKSMADEVHARALAAAQRYRTAEAELLQVFDQVERYRVHLVRGFSSLFQYGVEGLGLSENVVYTMIAVTRKAREVPALLGAIERGEVTLSNARRIVPLLTVDNQEEWIRKARELSARKLDREVARVRPEALTPESATYVTETRIRLELGLSEAAMLKLRRAQDLICQKRKRAASLEEVLMTLTQEFLHRNDPLEQAKRVRVRKGSLNETEFQSVPVKTLVTLPETPRQNPKSGLPRHQPSPNSPTPSPAPTPPREPIPAALIHEVTLRDQAKCAFVSPGRHEPCGQTRWLEIHHRIPVSQGGTNTLKNLITLCSAHHRWIHSQSLAPTIP